MSKIHAEVLTVAGLQQFDDVNMVRIKSDKYNLLIMQGFMPVIGEVVGTVEIVKKEDTARFADVRGYFTYSENSFSFLVNEVWDVT